MNSRGNNDAARQDEEDPAPVDVVYGERRSRERTHFHHRDSSSLYPAEMMERDVYYATAEEHLWLSLMFSQVFVVVYSI